MIIPLYFIILDLISNRKNFLNRLLNYLLIGGSLTAITGIIQFFLQFILGLNFVYNLWARIITPFLGNSFSQAVLQNPSWLVNIGGHTFLRATAFFPDPHMFAFYMGITAPIALGMFFYSRQKQFKTSFIFSPSIYLTIFCLLLLADSLSFSRGGYLGLLSGVSFFIIATIITTRKFNVFFLFFSASLFSVAIFLTILPHNIIAQRFFSSFNLSEGSNVGRLQTWQNSLEVIKENPFWGTGLGNYSLAIKPSANYREPIYSHNAFLDIAVETGILNGFIWLAILLISVNKFITRFRQNKNFIYLGIASGLIVFIVHSFFETAIFSVHILPLVILLISLTPQQNDKKTF